MPMDDKNSLFVQKRIFFSFVASLLSLGASRKPRFDLEYPQTIRTIVLKNNGKI